MPTRLTKEQLEQIRYVSMVDFARRIDEIESIDDKRKFAVQYLLSRALEEGEHDYSLAEATHIAKAKLSEASSKLKETFYEEEDAADYYIGDVDGDDLKQVVNPYATEKEEDIANEYFMGHAGGYLKNTALDIASTIEVQNENDIQETAERNKYLRLASKFDNEFDNEVLKLDDKPNTLDVKFRMEMNLGSSKALEDLYNNTKPSLGSRIFGTTSLASKNLDTAYKAFNNPNHAMYGDLATIEKAGNEYLQHKFPGWKPGMEFPSQQELERLDKTSYARTVLSMNLISAAKAQKEAVNNERELIAAAYHERINWKEVVQAEEINVSNQKSVSKDESSLMDESSIIEEEEIENKADNEKDGFLKDIAIEDKDEFLKDIAIEDKKASLKELKEGEEMNLNDEEFVEQEPDPDEEVYAVYDEFGVEDDAVVIHETAEALGESYLDEHEIKRVEEWKKQQAFEEKLKEDLEDYDKLDVQIDTKEQEIAFKKGTLKDPKPDPQEDEVEYPKY